MSPGTYLFSLPAQKICQIPFANMSAIKALANITSNEGLKNSAERNKAVKAISKITNVDLLILQSGHLFSKRVDISSTECNTCIRQDIVNAIIRGSIDYIIILQRVLTYNSSHTPPRHRREDKYTKHPWEIPV